MATQSVCSFNKYGYCKFRKNCRKTHVDESCKDQECEIRTCRFRHPKPCRYFQDFRRCKFSDCKFKHIEDENDAIEMMKNENRIILAKLNAIDENIKLLDYQEKMLEMENTLKNEISAKDNVIEELKNKLCNVEAKMNDLFEKFSLLEKDKAKKVEMSLGCSMCDFMTNSENGMKIHVRKKHSVVHKETYPRSCHICEEK